MKYKGMVNIGNKIRITRKIKGMSQMKLAEKIGISYQQFQKYEYGYCRITISRLMQISEALGVPVIEFFEKENALHDNSYEAFSEEDIRLLRSFRNIKNDDIRKMVLILAEKLVESS
jgi:transcriptional regulator with XRE-family HTH domain